MARNNKKPTKSRSALSRSKDFKKAAKSEAARGNYQDAFSDEEKSKKFPIMKVKSTKFSNDPQWYFKDEQVLRDVASFSFSTPLGAPIDWKKYYTTPPSSAVVPINFSAAMNSVPGLMSLELGLSVGVANNAQDPINLAATNFYGKIRSDNSGGVNYDAPDLMLYLVAMDSLYACWNWMKRIYGFASTYSAMNRYQPRAYMRANGIDMDDILANLTDFRGFLNIKAGEIRAFNVPALLTYNVRHSWLFSNIYKDGETDKAQEYMFTPSYFYKYDEISSTKGTQLIPVPVLLGMDLNQDDSLLTFANLRNILNEMLEAVNYSEDVAIMSGDIRKAFGDNLFTLSTIPEDYKVEPVYNAEVLSQIENAHFMALNSDNMANFVISHDPNTNYIKHVPTWEAGNTGIMTGQLLNMHMQSPKPEDVMVATRLCPVFSSEYNSTTDKVVNTLESSGSEIPVRHSIFAYAKSTSPYDDMYTATGEYRVVCFQLNGLYNTTSTNDKIDTGMYTRLCTRLAHIVMTSQFDWAPLTMVLMVDNSTNPISQKVVGVLGDIDKYTMLDNDDLKAMNLVALLAEFGVPLK